MTDHLTQNFVNLGERSFRPDRSTEFALEHRECRFDVRPFVVMGQKLLPVELVKVEHLSPDFAAVVGNGTGKESFSPPASLILSMFCRAEFSSAIYLEMRKTGSLNGSIPALELAFS